MTTIVLVTGAVRRGKAVALRAAPEPPAVRAAPATRPAPPTAAPMAVPMWAARRQAAPAATWPEQARDPAPLKPVWAPEAPAVAETEAPAGVETVAPAVAKTEAPAVVVKAVRSAVPRAREERQGAQVRR